MSQALKLIELLNETPSLRSKFKGVSNDEFERITKEIGASCTKKEFSDELKNYVSNLDLESKASEIAAAGIITTAVGTIF